jgi:hypothetical protein
MKKVIRLTEMERAYVALVVQEYNRLTVQGNTLLKGATKHILETHGHPFPEKGNVELSNDGNTFTWDEDRGA